MAGVVTWDIFGGNASSIEERLKSGLDPNTKLSSFRDKTPMLNVSILYNQSQIAHLLLDWKADIDWTHPASQSTAIHYAANRPLMSSVAERLIELKADVNQKTLQGESPLEWALVSNSQNNSHNVELLIIAGGADVFALHLDNLDLNQLNRKNLAAFERLRKWMTTA